MGVLFSLREASDRLAALRESIDREIVEEGHVQELHCDGLKVRLEPFYTDRKQTRQRVMIEGAEFACEIESHYWNILKPPTIRYWVWLDRPLEKVHGLLDATGLPRDCAMEPFYPEESGPLHYNASVRELHQVLALWRAVQRQK